jgi:hypothetical protein
MRIRPFAFLSAAACSLALAAASPAGAQSTTVIVQGQPQVPQGGPGYPPGYPPPAYPPGYGPGYTTPVYQQVQPSYVPQSVAFSGPRVINDWSEGEPIPPGYHESTRIRKGLVIGGAVLFGSTYLLSAFTATVGAANASENCSINMAFGSNQGCNSGNPLTALFIPAVGPFIQMAHSGNTAVGNFWLALDGVAQVGGITMFLVGLASPKTVLVRNDLGSIVHKKEFELSLAPIVSPQRQGMGVVGTF